MSQRVGQPGRMLSSTFTEIRGGVGLHWPGAVAHAFNHRTQVAEVMVPL